jgi:hypothetical protein
MRVTCNISCTLGTQFIVEQTIEDILAMSSYNINLQNNEKEAERDRESN